MVPRITTILQRFTTEWAARLQPEAILTVCGEIGYTGWRNRVLTPVTTVQLFL
jgi:alkylhydroperoxidase family enzyme